ncbi:MAG: 50S ribosomal protein L18 [Candidatus Pacebacteria bacterium]|nr:50S ribosomal protein L18 [Candidatus Paceibacterota bacterium]
MKNIIIKNKKEERRRKRNRARIFGTAEKPRLSVFRSNKQTYVQLIDDVKGNTLVSASTKEIKSKGAKAIKAKELGELLAQKAKKANISQAVFNKGPYAYHGRVKAIAESAREQGLKI